MPLNKRKFGARHESHDQFMARVDQYVEHIRSDAGAAELDTILTEFKPSSWGRYVPSTLAEAILYMWSDRLKKDMYPNTGWREYKYALRALARGVYLTRKNRRLIDELDARMVAARRCERVAAIRACRES